MAVTRTCRTALAALAGALALALAQPPRAAAGPGADDGDAGDDGSDPGSRDPELMSVHATLAGTTAQLQIRYRVDVFGPELLRDTLPLPLPDLASVVGATVRVRGEAHPLALGSAAAITAQLDALGALGASAAAGSANRSWAFAVHALTYPGNSVGLDAAAPKDATVVVELQATAPTCFFRDARYVAIRTPWLPHVDAAQRAQTSPALEAVCRRGLSDSDNADLAWIRLPTAEVASRPYGEQRIGVTAGAVRVPSGEYARLEVALAQVLADIPPDLYTAILVDNSISLDGTREAEQSALLASYFEKAPAGHVQVIAYDRTAHPLLPDWSVARAVGAGVVKQLDARERENGSNIDAALAEAGAWLAKVHGTRRVLLFTDELLPQRLVAAPDRAQRGFVLRDAAKLGAVLPPHTLVHGIALAGGAGIPKRDDESLLAPLAAASEGVGFTTTGDSWTGDGSADATVLVTPIALEHARVVAPGWTAIDTECVADMDLARGESCSWIGSYAGSGAAAPELRVTGQLWGHTVTRPIAFDPALELPAARAIDFSISDDKQRAELDVAARAVNSAWSLVAIWGGADGYLDHEVLTNGGFGVCGCGMGSIGTSGISRGTTVRGPLPTLRDQLAQAVAACKPGDAQIQIDFERTGVEIVDVTVAAPPALASCVVERVWATHVRMYVPRESRAHEHVELP